MLWPAFTSFQTAGLEKAIQGLDTSRPYKDRLECCASGGAFLPAVPEASKWDVLRHLCYSGSEHVSISPLDHVKLNQ